MTSWRSGLRLGYSGGRVSSFLHTQMLGVLWKKRTIYSWLIRLYSFICPVNFTMFRLERVVV